MWSRLRYCTLLSSHSDNNVKLIVLDKLNDLKENHPAVMQEMLMDIGSTSDAPTKHPTDTHPSMRTHVHLRFARLARIHAHLHVQISPLNGGSQPHEHNSVP